MPASYHVGAATSPTDLLSGIVAWLTGTQGWTQDAFADDGDGKRAHLHKGGVYLNLRSTLAQAIFQGSGAAPGIGIYLGTGYSAGSAWNAQPGAPLGTGTSYVVGSFMKLPTGAVEAWYGFDDGSDNVVVVVRRPGPAYTHLGFGVSAKKIGAWTGGPYFFAALPGRQQAGSGMAGDAATHAQGPFGMIQPDNSWQSYGYSGFVRADVDSQTGKWAAFSCTSVSWYDGYTGLAGVSGIDIYDGGGVAESWDVPNYCGLHRYTWSDMNGQAVLLPIYLYVGREAGGHSALASFDHLFMSGAVDHGAFQAESTVTIGAKTWVLFPRFAVLKAA